MFVTFPLYAKPCTVPQEHKGEQGRHRRCHDGLLLTAFLPFIHASDLLCDYYVPCSGLGCGECKKNQCQSSQRKTGRLQYINIYSVIESA